MSTGGSKGGKQVTEQAIIGERGINLIQRIVLEMGCGWHPSNLSLEAGIDGVIELVHPDTREATNAIIRVQSKATMRRWTAETPESFEYGCDERDLAYWLTGNAPVILVVSRPHLDEAYWVSIKDYFNTAATKKDRRIRFDKRTMRFTREVLPALFKIAMPASRGIYFAPARKTETLYANLLTVTRVPARLWLAETELRHAGDVFARLRESGTELGEFVLKNKRLLSAHDLADAPWVQIVDRGTVEEFSAAEWERSADADSRNLFLELLGHCLTARARQIGAVRRRGDGALFFAATPDGTARKVPFRSVKEATERTVYQTYPYTKGEHAGEVAYHRHYACFTQFRHYDGQWYLEITPTYHFTSDGWRQHPRADRYLAGIKRREKQGAVLYQLVMWASLLRGAEETDAALFSTNAYPFLRFGPLQTFTLEVGIDDKAWLPNEDEETAEAGEETLGELPLFEEPDPYLPDPAPLATGARQAPQAEELHP